MSKPLLTKFNNCLDDLAEFEVVASVQKTEESIHALEASRVELNYLWDQTRRTYHDCRDHTGDDEAAIDKHKIRKSFTEALGCYKRVLSALNDDIQTMMDRDNRERVERAPQSLPATLETEWRPFPKLPPCDTDVFHGHHHAWPSFRDLFTTLYIDNSRLSNVEKLFYLTQKTAGEAREIISHVPLTHDGFDIAWKNLVERYENRRMQINDQINVLRHLPSVSMDSAASIQNLLRTLQNCTQTLEALKVDTSGWTPILVNFGSQKLPRQTLVEFEESLSDYSEFPTWQEFESFLTKKVKSLESAGTIQPSFPKGYQPAYNKKEKRINTFQSNISHCSQSHGIKNNSKSLTRSSNEQSCQLCKQNHNLRSCSKFIEKNVNDRIHLVKISHLCYNCLASDHGIKECRSRFSCRHCNQRHHTLLHKGIESQPRNQTPVRVEARPSTSALTTIIQSTPNLELPSATVLTLQKTKPSINQSHTSLLFTAIVHSKSKGQRYDARAIIDPGSQSTFISEKLTNRLQLPTKRNIVHVSGVSQTVSEISTKACLFNLCSRVDPSFELEVWAPVLKTLPSNLPQKTIDIDQLNQAANLELADPSFYKIRPVDLLIGMDIGPIIYTMGVPMQPIGSFLAQRTCFGWIVGGPVNQNKTNHKSISLCNTTSIENVLTRFWEVQETPKKVLHSNQDIFCEGIFKATTRRDTSGRYIVTLPFKKCEDIKEEYDSTILEYLELGHMRSISNDEINKMPHYYLPHHPVIRPEKLTTKLRV